MKSLTEACLVGSILIAGAGVLYSQKPVFKQGIAVEMPVAGHAVEMRAADEQNATVVAMTADGRLFVGTEDRASRAEQTERKDRICKGRRSSTLSAGTRSFGRLARQIGCAAECPSRQRGEAGICTGVRNEADGIAVKT